MIGALMLASAVLGSELTTTFAARRVEAQTAQATANQIVLADYSGNERGVLELTPFGGVQPVVSGYHDDVPRSPLNVQPWGSTGLDLRDASGRVRASLALRPDGSPVLALLDASGRVIWPAPSAVVGWMRPVPGAITVSGAVLRAGA